MTGPIALERFGPYPPDGGEAAGGAQPDPAAENLTEPAEIEVDPETVRNATLARIAGALEVVATEQAGLRARCIGDTTAALGAAAETLLPRLAQAGFADLVAETAQTIARRGQWPELTLSIDADTASAVADALAKATPAAEIKVLTDPALKPGEAQLAWSQGGAEIDVEAFVETALNRFHVNLDSCLQHGA
jgi:hypothetical protein